MLGKNLWLAAWIGLTACGESSGDAPVADGGGGGATGDAAAGGSDAAPVDPGIEPVGGLRRFDLVSPMCSVELFDSGAVCPTDDSKCLCKPEFDALNPARGTSGNPGGRVIIIAQPEWGKRDDGSYALEHFATNTYRYTDANGNPATSGWGRSYDDDAGSPTFGTPSISAWDLVIERRARATKALPSLGGVASYCFACNGSGTGSGYRVQFSRTWSGIELP